jgi:hypothetical protein
MRNKSNVVRCVAVAATGLIAAAAARGSLVGVTIVDASSGDYTLTSITVDRGANTFTYVPADLIGVDLTDVDAFQIPLLTQGNASLPAAGTRAALIEDGRLDTGVVNITTTNGTPDRSMELTFASPVINSDGEDILLLELDGGDSVRFWINDDRTNRSADVAAASFSGSLISGMPYTAFAYNNAGDQDINSLSELESPLGFTANPTTEGTIRGVGLDLSAVGVPLGGSVDRIRLQSIAGAGGRVDPVFIAALPPVPEPAALALLALTPLIARRRRG